MPSLIHFRSRLRNTTSGGEKISPFSGRSMEIHGIREFSPSDSTRDIAWKKSTISEKIFTKEYTSEGSNSVIFGMIGKYGWNFSNSEHPLSKDDFTKSLEYTLKKTSHTFHFPFTMITTENSIQYLEKKKPKGWIILILSSSIDKKEWEGLEKFSKQNDIIILHIFHPFEKDPKEEKILLESKKIKYEKYKLEFGVLKKEIQDSVRKHGISIIDITSQDDAVLMLNFFFKNRYAR